MPPPIYLVHSKEDVSILCEVVAAYIEQHPAVIVYPKCEAIAIAIQAYDENLTIRDRLSFASLQLENPTIANLVIDYFGTTKSTTRTVVTCPQLSSHISVCASKNECKTALNDENGQTPHFIAVATSWVP